MTNTRPISSLKGGKKAMNKKSMEILRNRFFDEVTEEVDVELHDILASIFDDLTGINSLCDDVAKVIETGDSDEDMESYIDNMIQSLEEIREEVISELEATVFFDSLAKAKAILILQIIIDLIISKVR